MVNKNYVAGRNFEYKIKHILEKQGYFVLRSAGSHSPIDLISINKHNILLLQLKKDCKPTKEEIQKINSIEIPANGFVKKLIIIKSKSKLKVMYVDKIGLFDFDDERILKQIMGN